MTTTRRLVLMPEATDREQCPGPSPGDRLAALLGRRRLHFACLPADPSRLAGVLLICRGEPGRITVNGRTAAPRRQGPGRLLLGAASFRHHENLVCTSRGAGDIVLAPVIHEGRSIGELSLPPGQSWRRQTLAGHDLGPLPTAAAKPVPATGLVAGLARGLAAMVADNGDIWSFYDPGAGSFRLRDWRWDTGIVLEALAAGARHGFGNGLAAAARRAGDRLLAVQLRAPQCPGGFPEWTDLRYFPAPGRTGQWVVPFNAAFIAAGLMELSALTGEPDYAQAARESLHLAATTGLTPNGGVSGYYFKDTRQWHYLGQINDSGVLGRGLALFPGESWAATAAARSAAYLLGKAVQEDGHIARAWWDTDQAFPPGPPLFPEWKRHPERVVAKVFLRGQAWALMGLTGALRLGAGTAIARGARQLADCLLAFQQADGSWLYSQHQPQLGACAKTTAALALALAEWAAVAAEPYVRPAVVKALDALERCRRPDMVPPELAGLPVDTSAEGCIIYFRDRPVVCAYAGALELLARLAMGERA